MSSHLQHETVLLNEAVRALNIQADGIYIDGTYGRGGHSATILSHLSEKGRLIAIDKDGAAIEAARLYHQGDKRFAIWHGSFRDFPTALQAVGIERCPNGLLLDLGVSSPQLDDATRGFSFRRDGDLDMRMDVSSGLKASEWLASATEQEIAAVLWRYGEERFSRQIARNIVKSRVAKPLLTTLQLADLIARSIPKHEQGKHPATRSFQAIRIKINRELEDIETVLQQAKEWLAPNGRLVVISFHSLEDRLVKRFMREQSTPPRLPKGLPVMETNTNVAMKLIGKPIRASADEVSVNVRARSAIMRVAEKV